MPIQRSPGVLGLEVLEDRLTPTISFTSGTGFTYGAGSNGENVVTGDLTGNGRDDVLFFTATNGMNTYLSDASGNLTLIHTTPMSDARSAVLADLNGDHKLDLLVANGANDEISVYLGNGDGTFQTPMTFAVGGTALSVAVADFGDGHMDAVVADGGVALLKGTGTASIFSPAVQLGITGDNESVAVGDFNGDSKPDIVTGDYAGDKVTVLMNNGNATFAAPVSYALSWHGAGVATGDFAGNGRDDVVVSYGNISGFAVLLSNPDGTLQTPTQYSTPGIVRGIAIADFDLSGHLDIAVGDFSGTSGFVFVGNGDGTFGTSAIQVAAGNNPSAVAAGDLNGDGLPDLVTSMTTSPAYVNVDLNTSTVTLGKFGVSVPARATAGTPVAVTVTAQTGAGTTLSSYTGTVHLTSTDGLASLPSSLTFSAGDNGVKTVMVTFGTVGSQTITATDTTSGASGVSAAVAVTAPPAPCTVTLTPLDGPIVAGGIASFLATVTPLAGRPIPTGTVTLINTLTNQVIATLGLDSTGRAVFNVATLPVGTDSLRVNYSGDSYYGASSGTATQIVKPLGRIAVGSGEGAPSLISVYDTSGNLLTTINPFDGYQGGIKVAVGDVTGDGVADIIVGAGPGAPGGHIKIYDGQTFQEISSFFAYPGFEGGVSVAAGNVAGGGVADIIIGTTNDNDHVEVRTFTGGEVMSFYAFGPNNPVGVTVGAGDVEDDGRADVVVGSATGMGQVEVFQALTGTMIQSYTPFAGYTGGIFVAAGDVNGDGHADIIVGSATGDSHVTVFDGVTQASILNFIAYPGAGVGVHVGAVDLFGNGVDDILTGPAGTAPHVKAYNGAGALDLSFISAIPGQPTSQFGIYVAGSAGK